MLVLLITQVAYEYEWYINVHIDRFKGAYGGIFVVVVGDSHPGLVNKNATLQTERNHGLILAIRRKYNCSYSGPGQPKIAETVRY